MQDMSSEPIGIWFHNDDKTPREFVVSMLRSVFGKSAREAVEKASAEYIALSKEIAKCLTVTVPSAASIAHPHESTKRPNGAC